METVQQLFPCELFNLLAGCVGATEELGVSTFGNVNEEVQGKLMSISQDIVYLASKGKKQTPKSLCLGLTVRHPTGSSHLLEILHKFDHSSSWDTIIAFETSLALL